MKALAIIAVIFAGLSIFIPFGGIWLAMFCSVLALISFRSETTLSGVAFGINIVNTAFLSPSLVISDVISSAGEEAATEAGDLYFFYVGFHLVLLLVAVVWRVMRGAPQAADSPS